LQTATAGRRCTAVCGRQRNAKRQARNPGNGRQQGRQKRQAASAAETVRHPAERRQASNPGRLAATNPQFNPEAIRQAAGRHPAKRPAGKCSRQHQKRYAAAEREQPRYRTHRHLRPAAGRRHREAARVRVRKPNARQAETERRRRQAVIQAIQSRQAWQAGAKSRQAAAEPARQKPGAR